MNRVVITGMGVYSTIGENIEEVKNSLYKVILHQCEIQILNGRRISFY